VLLAPGLQAEPERKDPFWSARVSDHVIPDSSRTGFSRAPASWDVMQRWCGACLDMDPRRAHARGDLDRIHRVCACAYSARRPSVQLADTFVPRAIPVKSAACSPSLVALTIGWLPGSCLAPTSRHRGASGCRLLGPSILSPPAQGQALVESARRGTTEMQINSRTVVIDSSRLTIPRVTARWIHLQTDQRRYSQGYVSDGGGVWYGRVCSRHQ
jgi:hypothetical protein